ncbi:MAG: TlpA disulfide reductase family protein [Lachnospiraceae bacterium]|nr:TlpA disulfide reductase family protein [Lachnospiraceae bacterium]
MIKGTVVGMTEGKVFLKSFRNKMFFDVDTAEVKNGQFTFEGKVGQPLLYGLETETMSSPLQFFLENAKMEIEIFSDGDSLHVKDSKINDLFLGIAQKATDEGYNIDSLVTKYPASPVAAFYLYRYFTYQLPLDQLKATRAKLAPSLASCPYVTDLDGIIQRLENVQVGKAAPAFTLPDTAGVPVSLSSFKGKYVLVDFWASWCPYCRRENPNVVRVFNEYKDKNFTVLGVSLDKDKAKWMKAIADDKLAWTHVSDLKYWDSEIPALYAVRGIPANVLLNPDGVIIARNVMGEQLEQALQKELNK